jgi:5-aminolevulinate synthase
VEALVDVWRTLGLEFVEPRILPLRRPGPAAVDPHCVYPEMKRAAE